MQPFDAVRQVLEGRDDVRLAYLFGSTARGEARAASDVDIAVFFDPLPEPCDLDRLAEHLAGPRGAASIS